MSFLGSILGFAQGSDPTATRLILGDFEFLDFEVPERITIPGCKTACKSDQVSGVISVQF